MPNSGGIGVQDHRNLADWSEASNNTPANVDSLPIDMRFNDGHILSIFGYSFLMVASTIGNVTVLVLLIRKRLKGSSRIDAMLMHLAIADLLVTFLLMPLEIGWAYTVQWYGGDLLCRVMSFFRTFGLYLSGFVLVCISLDRYYAILRPLNFSGIDRRGRVMLLTAWIMSVVCSAPQAYIFHVEAHPNATWYLQCVTYHSFGNSQTLEVLYSVSTVMFMYTLPLIIIIYCYASIYLEIYRKTKSTITVTFRRSSSAVLGRAKRRTLRMTITIVIVFVVCWTPYHIMCFWYFMDRDNAQKVDQRLQKFFYLFACTNSCMNPIVYGIYNIRRKRDRVIVNQLSSLSKRSEGSTRKSIS
ncbi:gonadotropin-releasing hormone receptor [Sergentomyia squamirostris]